MTHYCKNALKMILYRKKGQCVEMKFSSKVLSKKDFNAFNDNQLIKEMLEIKEIPKQKDSKVFYTLRGSRIGAYIGGIVIYIILENGKIFIRRNDSDNKETISIGIDKEITKIEDYLNLLNKIYDNFTKYKELTNKQKEKRFSHNLINNIDNINVQGMNKIYIFESEFNLYLNKKKSKKSRIDLLGINEKGELVFIEVKIDGSVILGTNGINKHCHDLTIFTANTENDFELDEYNKLIEQMKKLNITDIPENLNVKKDGKRHYIIICGYTDFSKYDVAYKISALISERLIEDIKSDYKSTRKTKLVTVEGGAGNIKTMYNHFNDIKDYNPQLILTKVCKETDNIKYEYNIRDYLKENWQYEPYLYICDKVADKLN